jgi:AcrR family transcriptional regulator
MLTMTLETFRKQRSDQKRADILSAGLALFRRHGFAETSMEEVARTAQVSTATLYRHFGSKEALFEAVAIEGLDKIAGAQSALRGAPEARLAALSRSYAHFLCEANTRGLMRMLISETNRNSELSDRFYNSVKHRLSDLFAECVAAGMKNGRFRSHPNPAYIAGQLQGMIEHGTLLLGLIRGDETPPGLPPDTIANDAFKTWASHWLVRDIA